MASINDGYTPKTYARAKYERHVITLRKECFDKVCVARELANELNEQASIAMPGVKTRGWTLSEIIELMAEGWINEVKRSHDKAVAAISKGAGLGKMKSA